jgi:hypothetical protein
VLVHFQCDRCGAELTARPDFGGRSILCNVCRRLVTVPVVTSPPPVQPRLRRVEPDESMVTEVAVKADEEARRLAMIEARRETIRGRLEGIALAIAGGLAAASGSAGLIAASRLWIPRESAIAALAFGLLALIIGVTVWRLAVDAMREEFQRRVPGIADRLRRQYWEAHQSSSPPTSPRMPAA